MRLASFNVENLFNRARALNLDDWSKGRPILAAFERFTRISQNDVYSEQDREQMLRDLVELGVLVRLANGDRRRNRNVDSQWAWFRENRGDFLVAPQNGDARIVAAGRRSWLGFLELVTDPVPDLAIEMTARVIADPAVDADVLAVVEAEHRPALVRFNEVMLNDRYRQVMLIDGNDPRGIDVGVLTKAGYTIRSITSHVDDPDPNPNGRPRRLFSRDAPVYEIATQAGNTLWLIVNHLKSQSRTSGDPDPLRTRQANRVASIAADLLAGGADYVAAVGDFNQGDRPKVQTLGALLGPGSPLVDATTLPEFAVDMKRPGTWQTCSDRNRLDYIFLSPALADRVTAGGVCKKGLWGAPGNKNPPTDWTVYPDLNNGRYAASDHAAIHVDLDI